MLVHWRELGPLSEARRLAAMEKATRLFYRVLAGSDWEAAHQALTSVDPRLSLELLQDDEGRLFVLRYDEAPALPSAQFVRELGPANLRIELGRRAGSHDSALREVTDLYGISLETARVRVGVARGHLLEVVISIPLDISGDVESLQLAIEHYLEVSVGDETLDCWVSDVALDRIARTSGLLMVQDSKVPGETHPLSSTRKLIERGVRGILENLPERLAPTTHADQWTALTISELGSGLQAGRLHASTRFPEALKAALVGLPFSSRRFTRGGEVMIWISWSPPDGAPQERFAIRERVEESLGQHPQSERIVLAGTGFGRSDDYLDLWIPPESSLLQSLLSHLLPIVGALEAGFYDSCWAEEILSVSQTQADFPWILASE